MKRAAEPLDPLPDGVAALADRIAERLDMTATQARVLALLLHFAPDRVSRPRLGRWLGATHLRTVDAWIAAVRVRLRPFGVADLADNMRGSWRMGARTAAAIRARIDD